MILRRPARQALSQVLSEEMPWVAGPGSSPFLSLILIPSWSLTQDYIHQFLLNKEESPLLTQEEQLQLLQQFRQEETDLLRKQMPEFLKEPHCGVADGANDSYFHRNSKWKKHTLTYRCLKAWSMSGELLSKDFLQCPSWRHLSCPLLYLAVFPKPPVSLTEGTSTSSHSNLLRSPL